MKKNNDILLKSVLGGVIACFICVALVFVFPSKKTNDLRGINRELSNQVMEGDGYAESEIALGDESGHCNPQSAVPPSVCSGKSKAACDAASECYWVASATATPTAKPTTKPATTYSYCCVYNGVFSWYGNTTLANCAVGTKTGDTTKSACDAHNSTPAPTAACSSNMLTQSTCISEARAKCSYSYTGCNSKNANGCYSYTCNPAPTTVPTASLMCCCKSSNPTNCSYKSYCSSDENFSTTGCGSHTIVVTPTATPTTAPTATPSFTNVGNCASGLQLKNYQICSVPKGYECSAGGGAVTTSIKCTHPTCTAINCTFKGCTEPYTYDIGTECKYCPAGYKASKQDPNCYIDVSAGSYLKGGTTQINACKAGEYSTGGRYYLNGGDGSLTSCKACPKDTTSPIGAKSVDECVPKTGECKVSVSTSATKVSPKNGTCPNDNRYPDTFTVTVTTSGDGCNGGTLSMSSTGATHSGGSNTHKVTNGFTINMLYQPTTCCTSLSVSATVTTKDGKTSSGSVSVETSQGWHQTASGVCTTAGAYNSHYHSYKEADDAGGNEYWIQKDNPDCGLGSRKVDIYKRGCGGGGGGNPPVVTPTPTPSGPTPTPSPTPSGPTPTPTPVVVPRCYIKDDGTYTFTSNPQPSWKLVPDVSKDEFCKPEEQPACYRAPDGSYDFGKHAKDEGYTLIPSLDSTTCKKPDEEMLCYKNDAGDYKWSKTPIEGYTVVEGITIKDGVEACAGKSEEPACYIHIATDKFVWGLYEKVSGYVKLVDVDRENCKVPEYDACYKDKDGNYVWGKYGNDSNYKLVPSVSSKDQCKVEHEVPKTDMDVSKIVYIFMAILMACGIGFIYYSSAVKKHD